MKIDEAAIKRHHADGMRVIDIAALLNCSTSRIYQILHKDPEELRERMNRQTRGRRAKFYEKTAAIKIEAGCADCGYRENPVALQFDHLPGTEKLFVISKSGTSLPWRSVLLEIAKCDVVCANCHAIRTFDRGQSRGSVDVRYDPV